MKKNRVRSKARATAYHLMSDEVAVVDEGNNVLCLKGDSPILRALDESKVKTWNGPGYLVLSDSLENVFFPADESEAFDAQWGRVSERKAKTPEA